MDLHSGMVSVYLLLYLFIFLFLTLASSTLLANKYGGGFNAIPSQCFLKSVLPECSFEVRCPHLFKFLNFQCLHTTQFCSCSSYLFLCGLLSHEIIQAFLCYFPSQSNEFLPFSRIYSFWIPTPVPVSHKVLSYWSFIEYLKFRVMTELQLPNPCNFLSGKIILFDYLTVDLRRLQKMLLLPLFFYPSHFGSIPTYPLIPTAKFGTH